MKVLMLYHTKTGHTLEAIEATAQGLRAAGCTVEIVTAQAFDAGGLTGYDALVIGSPCWAGSFAHGLATPVKFALDRLGAKSLDGMTVAGIAVNGGLGGENTIATIGRIVKQKGCKRFEAGPVAKAGAPLSLWKGPSVTVADRARFTDFGYNLAETIKRGEATPADGI